MKHKNRIILTHGSTIPTSDMITRGEILVQHADDTINSAIHTVTNDGETLVSFPSKEWVSSEINKIEIGGITSGVTSVNGETGDVIIKIPETSNFVTKEEFTSTELTVSESLNDLNSRIENIDLSAFATKTELNNKQDNIVPGKNITITNGKTIDVIGYTYSSSLKTLYGPDCSSSNSSCFLYGTGLGTINNNEAVFGRYNKYEHFSGWGDGQPLLEVGDGTSSARKTVFMVQKQYGAAFASGGFKHEAMGDFAEYFEWEDGNANNEDRIGYMVTTNGEKILLAESYEDCIGVVTGTGAFVADTASLDWHGRFMKDEWGRNIYEEIDGEKVQKENPNYDPKKEYIPRMYRKEWSPIGLVGKLLVRQDGTLKVNGYAGCKNGIATDDIKGYRVLKIVNDEIALILLK